MLNFLDKYMIMSSFVLNTDLMIMSIKPP